MKKSPISTIICSALALSSYNLIAEENASTDDEMIEALPSGIGAAQLLQRISGIQVGSSDALGSGGFDSTINMRGFGKDQIGFSIVASPMEEQHSAAALYLTAL